MLPDVVRVTLPLDREVAYREETLAGPPRVFFDLKGVQLLPALLDAACATVDDIVRQIRVGRHPDGPASCSTSKASASYSVFTLYNPFRVVIDSERAAATARRPAGDRRCAADRRRPSRCTDEPTVASPLAAARAGAATVTPSRRPPAAAAPAEPPADRSAAIAPVRCRATPPTPPHRCPPCRPPTPPAASRWRASSGSASRASSSIPGHGGHDPGAERQRPERSRAHARHRAAAREAAAEGAGLDVVLTRRTDVYVPLEERTAIANREGADLFLSIHANASRNASARGVETYFLSFASTPDAEAVAARENSASERAMHNLPDIIKAIALNNKLDESRDLAAMVQEAMVTRLRRRTRTCATAASRRRRSWC